MIKLLVILVYVNLIRLAQADGLSPQETSNLLGAFQRIYYWYAYTLDVEINEGRASNIACGCALQHGHPETPCDFPEFVEWVELSWTRRRLSGKTIPLESHNYPEEMENVDLTAYGLMRVFYLDGIVTMPKVQCNRVIEDWHYNDTSGLIEEVSSVFKNIAPFTRRVRAIKVVLVRMALFVAENVDRALIKTLRENGMDDLLTDTISYIGEAYFVEVLDYNAVLNKAAGQSDQRRDHVKHMLDNAITPDVADGRLLSALIQANRNFDEACVED